MAIVTSTEMFKKAYEGYAIGAFNVNNMRSSRHHRAAMEERSPLILQVSSGAQSMPSTCT